MLAQYEKSHVTISLIGCSPHIYSIGPWYWTMWDYWHL